MTLWLYIFQSRFDFPLQALNLQNPRAELILLRQALKDVQIHYFFSAQILYRLY